MSDVQNWVLAMQRTKLEETSKRAVERSRYAKRHNGEIDEAWSMGEKLLNALIFMRVDQLEALDYSEPEAIDRLRFDFGVTADEFPAVLARIRAQL